jgi:hypothetical protein
MFCREHAAEFRPHEEELKGLGARLVFVSTGTPAMAEDFRDQQRVGADVWVDERRRTYRHLGFKRSPGSTFGLATLRHALRALRKGFLQGRTQGDPWQQGGVLVVRRGGEPVYCHASEEAGDLAPMPDVLKATRLAAQAGSGGGSRS